MMPNSAFIELDVEDAMTREAYANFGLALYHAQVVEYSLVNFIAVSRLITARENRDVIADPWTKEFRNTFASLVKRLRSRLDEQTQIAIDQVDIERCIANRNFLAHSYWRIRIDWLTTASGCQRIIDEMDSMVEHFLEVDRILSAALYKIGHEHGITEEVVRKEARALRAQALREEEEKF